MKTLEFWWENVNKQQSLVRKRYKFWCENVIFVVSKFGVKTLTFGVKTRAEPAAHNAAGKGNLEILNLKS